SSFEFLLLTSHSLRRRPNESFDPLPLSPTENTQREGTTDPGRWLRYHGKGQINVGSIIGKRANPSICDRPRTLTWRIGYVRNDILVSARCSTRTDEIESLIGIKCPGSTSRPSEGGMRAAWAKRDLNDRVVNQCQCPA